MDQNPGRWLVATGGAVFCEAGVQSMLTSQTTSLPHSIGVAAIGAVLILVSVFWNKLGLQKTVFFEKLNKIASHPALWIALIGVVWISAQVVSAVHEALLNNEIIALRNDEQSIARVIDRGVLPRHLTKRQQFAISSFLLQFDPHEYAFQLPLRDNEAGQYRGEIEQALIKGGWTRVTTNPYDYKDDLPEGLSLNFIQKPDQAQKPDDPRNPRADRLLMMALGLAGVRLDQAQGSTGINVTEDRLVIGMGKRRMDSCELDPPPSFPF